VITLRNHFDKKFPSKKIGTNMEITILNNEFFTDHTNNRLTSLHTVQSLFNYRVLNLSLSTCQSK